MPGPQVVGGRIEEVHQLALALGIARDVELREVRLDLALEQHALRRALGHALGERPGRERSGVGDALGELEDLALQLETPEVFPLAEPSRDRAVDVLAGIGRLAVAIGPRIQVSDRRLGIAESVRAGPPARGPWGAVALREQHPLVDVGDGICEPLPGGLLADAGAQALADVVPQRPARTLERDSEEPHVLGLAHQALGVLDELAGAAVVVGVGRGL